MRKFLILSLAVLVAGALFSLILPWWVLPILAGLAAWLVGGSPGGSFLAGLVGGFLCWFGYAYWQDAANAGILSARIGELFQGIGGVGVLLATGILSGLLGGLGALTGSLFGKYSRSNTE